jgi:D-3-phosphoglycerate dehydrogenase
MFKILTLNNIAPVGLERLPGESYEVGDGVSEPDAILLRSYDMHSMDIPDSVKAMGRAGAGVNNIPIEAMSKRGEGAGGRRHVDRREEHFQCGRIRQDHRQRGR